MAAPEDHEQQFKSVAEAIQQMISDARHRLDLVEVDMAHWAKEGINQCEGHTKTDMMANLEGVYNLSGQMGVFLRYLQLLHATTAHKDELDPLSLIIMEATVEQYRVAVARYLASQGSTSKEPSSRSTNDWLERIFGKKDGDS